MNVCVYCRYIYESRSDRFHDIYHEINVKNHSSANSLQVPYFLIRRAAKKVKFIANMRTDLRVCECVCILPMYTIHAVTVLTTFITKSTSKIIALRIASRCHIFLFAEQRKKVTFIANMRTDLRVCECVCILPIYTSHAVTVFTTFITKSTSKIIAMRIASRCHIFLFAEQRKK